MGEGTDRGWQKTRVFEAVYKRLAQTREFSAFSGPAFDPQDTRPDNRRPMCVSENETNTPGLARRSLALLYDGLLLIALWLGVSALVMGMSAGQLAEPDAPLWLTSIHRISLVLVTVGFFGGFWTHGGQNPWHACLAPAPGQQRRARRRRLEAKSAASGERLPFGRRLGSGIFLDVDRSKTAYLARPPVRHATGVAA